MKGKSYSTNEEIGANVWRHVEERLDAQKYREGELAVQEPETRYGNNYQMRARIGQGAFRAMVTDAYSKRCAVTGERTLPVLEAAHIKPYAEAGPNLTSNGILLRSDMHILFDKGYVTVSNDHHLEVSQRIREEYENGREYYAYHGNKLFNLPEQMSERPSLNFLSWHQEQVYKG